MGREWSVFRLTITGWSKQGVKYDSPASAAEIPGFIAFHNLDLDEILDPLDSFKTFNEFFYRYLHIASLSLICAR